MFAFRYPAVIILACAVAGTLLGRWTGFGISVALTVLVSAVLFLLYVVIRLPREWYIVPLALTALAAALMISTMKYQSFPPDDIGAWAGGGERLRFFGNIEKWPVLKRGKTVLTCRVDSIVKNDTVRTASGSVLVTISRETTHFSLGDKISFSGKLTVPRKNVYPERFDYGRYLYNRGIRGTVYVNDAARVSVLTARKNIFGRAVGDIRRWILACFQKNLTEIPSALASGFLIGETRDIPPAIYQAFRRTGTMHLLAVSGSNVVLILIVMAFLLRFFPLRSTVRLIILLAVIIVFSHLSYNQPSVVRASVMASMILVARAVYRRAELNNIIAATAAILVFFDPGNLFDIGFQLSFAVAWALILFLPHINRLFERSRMTVAVRYLLLIVSSSLIASLVAAPITSYYFGRTSLVTIASNLAIVPPVSAAVIGIVFLLIADLILPALAILPGLLLDRLLRLIDYLVGWFDSWPLASVDTGPFPAVVVPVALAATTCLFLSIKYSLMRRAFVFLVIVSLIGYLAVDIFAYPDMAGIEVFNTGGSQAFVIDAGGGLVIYRQAAESRYDDFSQNLLPYLKSRSCPWPRYFIFMEPRHRTERRFDLMETGDSRLNLQPIGESVNSSTPSLWGNGDCAAADPIDTTFAIYRGPGRIIVSPGGLIRLIFSERVECPPDYFSDCPRENKFSFFFAKNDNDLGKIVDCPRLGQVSILLEQNIDTYKILTDTGLVEQAADIAAGLLEKGTARRLTLEEQD